MSPVTRFLFKITALTGMLVGLPVLGVYVAGYPVERYLEFPPQTRFVQHEPFSWLACAAMISAIAAVVVPLAICVLKCCFRSHREAGSPAVGRFPWWGWAAVGTGLVSWIAAWTRFSWLAGLQAHTFVPLWLSYVVTINALTYRKNGHCMMIDHPGFFVVLFPMSAAFWWYFEYLNRFVQNWYYVGSEYGAWAYFGLATVSFSTVLPAALGTRELLLSYCWIRPTSNAGKTPRVVIPPGSRDQSDLPLSRPTRLTAERCNGESEIETLQTDGWRRFVPWFVLGLAGIGLALIGVLPNYLFPVVWVSPALIIVSLQAVLGEHHIVSDMLEGIWHPSVSAALAALVCGWFWEMWNYHSLAKWEYSIPFVDRFHLFEMPILGYAGYLPFGLECLVVGLMLEGLMYGKRVV